MDIFPDDWVPLAESSTEDGSPGRPGDWECADLHYYAPPCPREACAPSAPPPASELVVQLLAEMLGMQRAHAAELAAVRGVCEKLAVQVDTLSRSLQGPPQPPPPPRPVTPWLLCDEDGDALPLVAPSSLVVRRPRVRVRVVPAGAIRAHLCAAGGMALSVVL
jgi:hypothetical protein